MGNEGVWHLREAISPESQVGVSKILWGMGEYGLQGVWVKRESTVAWGRGLPPNCCLLS